MTDPVPIFSAYIDDIDTVLLIESYLDKLAKINIFEKGEHVKKHAFVFNTNMYVYYEINNKLYVDVNHITASMNSTDIFEKELIDRDLIDINTMGSIIISYDCDFQKNFKKELMTYLIIIYLFFMVNISRILKNN